MHLCRYQMRAADIIFSAGICFVQVPHMPVKETVTVMLHEEEIGRLEQFVEKLLAGYNSLKVEYDRLQQELRLHKEQNRELRELADKFQAEKETMYNRVTGLIDRIDVWEKENEQGKEMIQPAKNIPAEAVVDDQNSLFSMGVETNQKPAVG